MTNAPLAAWRILLIISGLLILIGGPMHPGGTMEQMLANPRWIPGHSLVLLGFVLFLAALGAFRNSKQLPSRTQNWLKLAIAGAVLQTIEMAFHTAAVVDHDHLAAGQSTPVLSTHLTLS